MTAGPVMVCGLGRIGYRATELLLRLGHAVTVVTGDARPEWRERVEERGVTVFTGDARDERLLQRAGLGSASALLAVTDRDLVNIEIALDAKRLRPDLPVVVRLFDQQLAQQLEESFDIRRALAMSALSAPVFAAAAFGERVLGSFSLDGTVYVIGKVDRQRVPGLDASAAGTPIVPLPLPGTADRVPVLATAELWDQLTPRAPLTGAAPRFPSRWRTLGTMLHPRAWMHMLGQLWHTSPLPLRILLILNMLLVAAAVMAAKGVMDLSFVDALYFVVTTITTVGYGDITAASAEARLFACAVMLLGAASLAILYSIITDFVVTSRVEQMFGFLHFAPEDHVVVAGLGNVGYRIVESLRKTRTRVLAIESDPESSFVGAVRPDISVVVGDARASQTLEKAAVDRAAAVIAATDDDAVNLGVVLAARKLNPRIRTVTRLFDPGFAQKVETLMAVDVAMSPSMLAAPTFVAAALIPDVRYACVVGDTLLVLRRLVVAAEWEGRSPAELAREGVAILLRGVTPGAYQANGDAPLGAGEQVLVAATRPLAPAVQS